MSVKSQGCWQAFSQTEATLTLAYWENVAWSRASLSPFAPLLPPGQCQIQGPRGLTQLRISQALNFLKREKMEKRQEGEGKEGFSPFTEATHVSRGGRMGPLRPALPCAPMTMPGVGFFSSAHRGPWLHIGCALCMTLSFQAFLHGIPLLHFITQRMGKRTTGALRSLACSAVGHGMLFWEGRSNAKTNPTYSMHGKKAWKVQ